MSSVFHAGMIKCVSGKAFWVEQGLMLVKEEKGEKGGAEGREPNLWRGEVVERGNLTRRWESIQKTRANL